MLTMIHCFRVLAISFISLNVYAQESKNEVRTIGRGQMPGIIVDKSKKAHIVFGRGDSLLYVSSDESGESYSTPLLIKRIPGLAANYMRGPQIASTSQGLVIIAANTEGNIFSFTKQPGGEWQGAGKVNDEDTVAKENFVALSADGNKAVAVWLDLRGNARNKIYGSVSTDGGKEWSKNFLVYASPDSTVCECCKPSVAIRGKDVYVMFRNWLNGNRDLYLIHSSDLGKTFEPAQKLGLDSWQLDGCPMDGGGLVIDENGIPQTVWRRKDKIYGCVPGQPEQMIGEGKSCTLASVNGKNVYAWVHNGVVSVLKPNGQKITLGSGFMPVLSPLDDHSVLCVWENDKQIQVSWTQ